VDVVFCGWDMGVWVVSSHAGKLAPRILTRGRPMRAKAEPPLTIT